jgi:hypothetical protein
MAQHKLSKHKVRLATIHFNADDNGDYSHPTLTFHLWPVGEEWASIKVEFQRHRLDDESKGSAGIVQQRRVRAVTANPWLDVGRVPYSPCYGADWKSIPMRQTAVADAIWQVVQDAVDRCEDGDDVLAAWHSALVEAGVAVVILYGYNKYADKANVWSDLPPTHRGHAKAFWLAQETTKPAAA